MPALLSTRKQSSRLDHRFDIPRLITSTGVSSSKALSGVVKNR